jgi:hypothetical protein
MSAVHLSSGESSCRRKSNNLSPCGMIQRLHVADIRGKLYALQGLHAWNVAFLSTASRVQAPRRTTLWLLLHITKQPHPLKRNSLRFCESCSFQKRCPKYSVESTLICIHPLTHWPPNPFFRFFLRIFVCREFASLRELVSNFLLGVQEDGSWTVW